jgi:hypothetical protein
LKDKLRNEKASETVNLLSNFGAEIMGEVDFNLCKDFRQRLIHGNRKYTNVDIAKMLFIEDEPSRITRFFQKLLNYISCAQGKVGGQISTTFESEYKLTDLFKAYDPNIGIEITGDPSELAQELLNMLQGPDISGWTGENDEFLVYSFTVTTYAMVMSKKSHLKSALREILEQRGNLIHQFDHICRTEEGNISMKRRHLLIVNFCRSYSSLIYKAYLACKVHNCLLNSYSTLEDTLTSVNVELIKTGKGLNSYRNYDKGKIQECIFDYLILMPPIDDKNFIQNRKGNQADLTASDRRDLYVEFSHLKHVYKSERGDFIEKEKEFIDTISSRMAIDRAVLSKMIKSFVRGPDQLSPELESLAARLYSLVHHYSNSDGPTSLQQYLDSIPEHRRFTEDQVGEYVINNIHEHVLAIFCSNELENPSFENPIDAFADPSFLECLTRITRLERESELSAIFRKLDSTPVIAPYLATIVTGSKCKTSFRTLENLQTIFKCLLNSKDISSLCETLVLFLHWLSGFRAQQGYFKLVVRDSLRPIIIHDWNSLKGIMHAKPKSGAPQSLDETCILKLLKLFEGDEDVERNLFKLINSCFTEFYIYADSERTEEAISRFRKFFSLPQFMKLTPPDQIESLSLYATWWCNMSFKNRRAQLLVDDIERKHVLKIVRDVRILAMEGTFVLEPKFTVLQQMARHASVMEKNHALSLKIYKYLFKAVLSECNATSSVASTNYEVVVNSEKYKFLATQGKCVDLITILQGMAYESRQVGEDPKIDLPNKKIWFKNSIELYSQASELYKLKNNAQTTHFLNPIAQVYYRLYSITQIGQKEKIDYLHEAISYKCLVFHIAYKAYMDTHPFVIKTRLEISNWSFLMAKLKMDTDPSDVLHYLKIAHKNNDEVLKLSSKYESLLEKGKDRFPNSDVETPAQITRNQRNIEAAMKEVPLITFR